MDKGLLEVGYPLLEMDKPFDWLAVVHLLRWRFG